MAERNLDFATSSYVQDAVLIKHRVKLFFLCSPHNPVGRVWTKEELTGLGDLCLRHRVIVVSDEIHGDFAFQGKHQVFANLKEAFANFTVTCTSPSKTFNLAGFQRINAACPRQLLREALARIRSVT